MRILVSLNIFGMGVFSPGSGSLPAEDLGRLGTKDMRDKGHDATPVLSSLVTG